MTQKNSKRLTENKKSPGCRTGGRVTANKKILTFDRIFIKIYLKIY